MLLYSTITNWRKWGGNTGFSQVLLHANNLVCYLISDENKITPVLRKPRMFSGSHGHTWLFELRSSEENQVLPSPLKPEAMLANLCYLLSERKKARVQLHVWWLYGNTSTSLIHSLSLPVGSGRNTSLNLCTSWNHTHVILGFIYSFHLLKIIQIKNTIMLAGFFSR